MRTFSCRKEGGADLGELMSALPRLTRENAAAHIPPDLRRSESRGSAGSWYQQMMGYEWDGSGKSSEVAN